MIMRHGDRDPTGGKMFAVQIQIEVQFDWYVDASK